ncbi:hypothetical protein [Sorangium sp. So ce1000]|uniref:hypothetical protein n=1 Tax=Sorangium sp. So ce1000 TaxID=3133325 RepID=UPI003F604443
MTAVEGATPRAVQMPADLRALALCLGGPFAGLSRASRRRLAFLCDNFAELLQAEGRLPAAGDSLRAWPRFLLSALFALRFAEEAPSLSDQEEQWLVAEVEAEFREARAAVEGGRGYHADWGRPVC